MGFLIDTSIWIDVERGRLAPADVASLSGSEAVFISPVTIAELQFGAERAGSSALRQKRFVALARLKRKPILLIDEATGEIFGRLAAEVAASGRGHRYRVQDLWLASQAIQHNLTFLTRDEKDFEDIPGLDLVLLPQGDR